jgi:hypothetical protein
MDRPGWRVADGSTPQVGECVFCVDGEAEVVRVLGRTGDGSRLLELLLAGTRNASYFAAASNVLRRLEPVQDVTSLGKAPADRHEMIGKGTTGGFIGGSES